MEAQGLKFTATVSRFDDGNVAEIFLRNHKAGSMAGTNAQDTAVLASIALQHGVPLDVIRRELMRDSRGNATGPLRVALDLIAGGRRERPRDSSPTSAPRLNKSSISRRGSLFQRSTSETSAFNRMRAFNSRRAGPFPLRISVSSCWRSSPLNLTTYFFTEISFLAMILSIARIMAKENHRQRKSPSPFKLAETSD